MPRLLLVEDEQANRDLFQRRLERKGYTVIAAENGLSAVALTASERPDLVLMDLGLPDIDGWEATRRIKSAAATASIPVLVLSAHATTEAQHEAFAAGCEAFETKPVNWDSLFKKIEDALERVRQRALAATFTHSETTTDEVDLGAPAALDCDSATKVRHSVQGVASEPKRILVVEDNDANRTMLCRRLNKHGYVTGEAADGSLALDAVRAQHFDLVLCDIMMPGVDGYTVLREMKADPALQAIPVIMISALDEVGSVGRCIEMGAEDYLQKPYDPVLLRARITASLDKRRLREREGTDLRALMALKRVVVQLENGNYDPSLLAPVTARDDAMGDLARALDQMARTVAARAP